MQIHKEDSYRLLGQCVCPNPFLNAIYCSCNFSLWLIYGFHAISSPFISSPNFYTFSNLYFFSKLKLTYFLFFTFLQLLFYFVLSIFISSTLHLCYFNYWLCFNLIYFQKPFALQICYFPYFYNFTYQPIYTFLFV